MIYKIACGVLLLGVIFLGTRLKVAEDITQSKIEEMSEKGSIYSEMKFKNEALSAQVDHLMSENAELINQNNELKNQQPKIITRYVKKNTPINDDASVQYNEQLSKRYELN